MSNICCYHLIPCSHSSPDHGNTSHLTYSRYPLEETPQYPHWCPQSQGHSCSAAHETTMPPSSKPGTSRKTQQGTMSMSDGLKGSLTTVPYIPGTKPQTPNQHRTQQPGEHNTNTNNATSPRDERHPPIKATICTTLDSTMRGMSSGALQPPTAQGKDAEVMVSKPSTTHRKTCNARHSTDKVRHLHASQGQLRVCPGGGPRDGVYHIWELYRGGFLKKSV